MDKKYKIIVIAVLLKNGIKAKYGEVVTDAHLTENPAILIKRGLIKELTTQELKDFNEKSLKEAKDLEDKSNQMRASSSQDEQFRIDAENKLESLRLSNEQKNILGSRK